jgi:hypothetical protein
VRIAASWGCLCEGLPNNKQQSTDGGCCAQARITENTPAVDVTVVKADMDELKVLLEKRVAQSLQHVA